MKTKQGVKHLRSLMFCSFFLGAASIGHARLPNAGAITGPSEVCRGNVISLANPTADTFFVIGKNYGGGKVAYILQPGDLGYSVGETNGLISSLADQDNNAGIIWNNGTSVGVTSSAIGSGAANTDAIIAAQGAGNYAASLARTYTGGGYTDWYLPSLDELRCLRANRDLIGGFVDEYQNSYYWSSTEYSSGLASCLYFFAGNSGAYLKSEMNRVRAVRSFSTPALVSLTWSSSNSSVATVSNSGIVTGVAAGTAIISYEVVNVNGTSVATTTVTVNATTVNAGSPVAAICAAGATAALGGSFSGASSAIWSDGGAGGTFTNNGGATPGSAIYIASASSASPVTLTLTLSGAVCSVPPVSKSLVVRPLPVISSIGNNGPVCAGMTLLLNSAATGGAGMISYAWAGANGYSAAGASSSVSPATVAASGVYTLVASDIYGCADTAHTTAVVNPVPSISMASNDGPVCVNSALTFNSTASGGTGSLAYSWSGPDNFSAAGSSAAIPGATLAASGNYTLVVTDANHCADTAVSTATVHPRPLIAAIGSNSAICEGSALDLFSTVTGGDGNYTYTWSGPNGFSSAEEDPEMVAAPAAAGGTYILDVVDGNDCAATGVNTTDVTVNAILPIIGDDSVMFGQTITLSDAVTGGTWRTTTPWVAGITPATGVLRGVSAGTAVLSYVMGSGCYMTHTVTVFSNKNVCIGQTITLTDTLIGGTWISNNGSIASVGLATGVVTGIGAGRATITHRTATAINTMTVTVNPLAATTAAPATICQGQSTPLVNTTAGGGTWYSANTAIAIVGGTGVATGLTGGTATIYFTPHTGCATAKTITINGVTPITGGGLVCVGQTTSVSNSTAGGVWSTSAGAIASISAAGVVKGMAAGNVRISYIWPNGCQAVKTVTVNALSPVTGGTQGMCQSGTMTLANATPFGGVWASSNTSVATISSTGVVRGVGAGTATISFTATVAGCVATRTLTVNACREAGGDDGNELAQMQEAADAMGALVLFPNPNNGVFTLSGTVTANNAVDVVVVNMIGQVVYSCSVPVQNGRIDKQIELSSGLAQGVYMLSMTSGNERKVFHFVVQ